MAACKCRYCQSSLKTTNAHMEYISGKKAYFCSEEHYNKFQQAESEKKKKQEREARTKQKFYELFCEILGVNGITNTALWKEKTEINKVFSDEVIISYLEENKNWITTSVSKLSGGEYGKIRYVSVILRNKLGDYNPKATIKEVEKPKVQVDDGFYVISHKQNGKRRSLDELEDEY